MLFEVLHPPLWSVLYLSLFEETTTEFLNKSLQRGQKNYQSKKSKNPFSE
jgi:hypothetical protein